MLASLDLAGVGTTLDRQMLAKGPWLAPRPSGGILCVLLWACLGDCDTAFCFDFCLVNSDSVPFNHLQEDGILEACAE